MTNYQIRRALTEHLKTMPNVPKILEENIAQNLNAEPLFIAAYFLPVDTRQTTFCGNESKSGIVQFSVFAPRDTGYKAAQECADRVSEYLQDFDHNALAVTRVTQHKALQDALHYQIPLSVYYTHME